MDVETFRARAAQQGFGEISEVRLAPDMYKDSHTHDYAATLLILEGELSVTYDGQSVTCRAGEPFSLPAGMPHTERTGVQGARLLIGRAAQPNGSIYRDRARWFDSSTAFNITHPPVPCHQFTAESARAFDPGTGTAAIALDQGPAMGLDFPATTPLVLAHYLRIAAGERLPFESAASAELYFVIQGAGRSRKGQDAISWSAGDAFALPGGAVTEHNAEGGDAILWAATNSPLLALDGLAPPPPHRSLTEAAHFPADEMARQMMAIRPQLAGTRTPGIAVVLASAAQESRRNVSPGLTFAMNQLPPGGSQLPHRHNSVAISLAVNGPRCSSVVDGARTPWEPWSTLVTPPGAVHSHHNDSDDWAHWLIVQDGGYHYHCRTMEFRYADGAA